MKDETIKELNAAAELCKKAKRELKAKFRARQTANAARFGRRVLAILAAAEEPMAGTGTGSQAAQSKPPTRPFTHTDFEKIPGVTIPM